MVRWPHGRRGAVLLLLMVSAALAAWAVPHGPEGYGTRVHGLYAPAAASASTPVQLDIPRAGVHAGTVAVGAAASGSPKPSADD
ncbi:hypothetical protein ABZ746_17920 [Streptomyces sp. NPDC020096]